MRRTVVKELAVADTDLMTVIITSVGAVLTTLLGVMGREHAKQPL